MKYTKIAIACTLLVSMVGSTAFAAPALVAPAADDTLKTKKEAPVAVAPKDIKGHWAKEGIEEFISKGYIAGYEDGTFKPDAQVTRAEFMKMINESYGFTAKAEIAFSDVHTGDWYYDEVAKIKAAGCISGYEDGTMRPNDPISRQEATLIFFKLKKLVADEGFVISFSDSSTIADWAKGAVGAVVKAGYMKGYPENTFMPKKFLARAEAVIVARGSLVATLLDTDVPQGTPAIPAVPGHDGEPATPAVPANPNDNGGGSNHGGGSHNDLLEIETTAVSATIDGKDVEGTIDDDTATIKMPTSGALSMLKIEGTEGVTLTINDIKGTNTKLVTKNMEFTDMNEISIADVLGNTANTSIDVATLKVAFGGSDEITMTGDLTKAGYDTRKVTLVLDLDATVGHYSNAYFEADTSGKVVTVKIKQPDALISKIGMKNMILGVSQSANILPVAVEIGAGADKVDFSSLLDDSTQDAIRDKISEICGTWSTAKLSDLVDENDALNMKLKDIGDKAFTVEFTEL